MNKLTKGAVSAAVLISLIGVVSALAILIPKLQVSEDSQSLGSVSISESYIATTTNDYDGTALANLSVLKKSPGQLGSVTITGAAAGVINLYDATSTVTNTEWATTTLVTIPASAAAGTYTLDASFTKGLLYELIGTAPTSTITFK